MSTISLQGIQSIDGEERVLLHIDVDYNNNLYHWKIYKPVNIGLQDFLSTCNSIVEAQIDAKELEWTNLDPKTRTIINPITQEETTVDISKDEIVHPDIPDYYAVRRKEYPALSDQVEAIWKGIGSKEFTAIQDKISAVKIKYPNEVDKLASQRNDIWEQIKVIRQTVIEGGVKVLINGVDKWFHTDTFSRTQWIGLLLQGQNLPSGIMWKTMDNTFIELTPTIVQQVINNTMVKETLTFGYAEELKQTVMAASNPTAIDVTTGWPESYNK